MAQQICSAWDWDKLKYDYYHSPNQISLGGWRPMTGMGLGASSGSTGVGIDIEDALPRLPHGSRWIGSGAQAMGTIVKPTRQYQHLGGPKQAVMAPTMRKSAFGGLYVQTPIAGLGTNVMTTDSVQAYGGRILDAAQAQLNAARARFGVKVVAGFLLGINLGRKFPTLGALLSWVSIGVVVAERMREVKAGEFPPKNLKLPDIDF